MPTSPRGRGQSAAGWGERHPGLSRALNGGGALVAFAATAVLYTMDQVVAAGGVALLGLVLTLGVVWPRFNAVALVLDVLTDV